MTAARAYRIAMWSAFAVAAAAVLYYSLRPGPSGTLFMWRDKFQHMAAYGTLALLSTLASGGRRRAILWVAALAAAGYAVELVQPLVGRSHDWRDQAANMAGCLIGFLLARGAIRLWHARRPD